MFPPISETDMQGFLYSALLLTSGSDVWLNTASDIFISKGKVGWMDAAEIKEWVEPGDRQKVRRVQRR